MYNAYRMLLLLDIENGAVLKGPLDDVGLGRGALDPLALLELAPELGEVVELEEVPDFAGVGFDDGGFADRVRGWDCRRHVVRVVLCNGSAFARCGFGVGEGWCILVFMGFVGAKFVDLGGGGVWEVTMGAGLTSYSKLFREEAIYPAPTFCLEPNTASASRGSCSSGLAVCTTFGCLGTTYVRRVAGGAYNHRRTCLSRTTFSLCSSNDEPSCTILQISASPAPTPISTKSAVKDSKSQREDYHIVNGPQTRAPSTAQLTPPSCPGLAASLTRYAM